MPTIDFSEQIDLQLVVNQGFLEYLAELDPTEEWDRRGVAGKNSDELREWQSSRDEKLNDILQQDDFLEKVQSFVNDARPIYDAFLQNDREAINDILGDWSFYFIVGPPRTGGTYIYTQVSEAFNWPWEGLFRSITHDNMPDPNFLRDDRNKYGDIAWRRPAYYVNIIFQLSCFIEYARREAPNSDSLVLKNMGLCQACNLLDRMFEEKAHYLVTVRHPAAMAASRAESWPDQDNTEGFKRACFELWYNIYAEVLRDGQPTGELKLLKFGDDMDRFLDDLYASQSIQDRSEQVRITDRNYHRDFWEQDEYQEKMDWIEEFYQLHGIEFPMPDTIR